MNLLKLSNNFRQQNRFNMATAPPFTTEGYPYQNPPSYQSQYPQAHANQGFNDPSHNINQGTKQNMKILSFLILIIC